MPWTPIDLCCDASWLLRKDNHKALRSLNISINPDFSASATVFQQESNILAWFVLQSCSNLLCCWVGFVVSFSSQGPSQGGFVAHCLGVASQFWRMANSAWWWCSRQFEMWFWRSCFWVRTDVLKLWAGCFVSRLAIVESLACQSKQPRDSLSHTLRSDLARRYLAANGHLRTFAQWSKHFQNRNCRQVHFKIPSTSSDSRNCYIIYIYIYVLVPGPSTPPPPMVWSPPSGPRTPPKGGRGPFYTHSRHTLYTFYIRSIYNLYRLYTSLYSLYTYYILFPLPHNIPPPQGGGGVPRPLGGVKGGGVAGTDA